MIIFYCLIQNKIEIIFVDYFSIYYYNKLLTIFKFYNSLKKLISFKDFVWFKFVKLLYFNISIKIWFNKKIVVVIILYKILKIIFFYTII